MDLLSSIRKSGSRGGVNFSWEEVSTSQHRENYLGHSLMAPVGRWQKGKDLNWYAKADDDKSSANETAEEKRVRERKEEIRRIKEAEEDALSRALGLPVPVRNGEGTGSNNIDIGEMRRVIKDTEEGDDEIDEVGKSKGFGDFVGRVQDEPLQASIEQPQQGGLMGKDGERLRSRRDRGREGRDRSRSRERRHRRHRHRSRSGDRHRYRRRDDERPERRERSRSGERRDRRYRSRSADRYRSRRDDREPDREPRRDSDRRPRRSRSPNRRDRGSGRDRD